MPLPANFATASGIWVHRDSNLAAAVEDGYGRALRRDWSTGSLGQRTRAFQALTLERAMLMASLAGTIEENPGAGLAALINPSPLPSTPPQRRELVTALYATAALLALRTEPDQRIETSATESDTGFIIAWPVAVVLVAVVVAGAAALSYCAHQAAAIVDKQLARSEDASRLAQRDAELMKVIRDHQEQEAKSGKQLPLSESERLALNGLLAQQHAIVSKADAPLDSGVPSFDGGSLLSGIGGVALGVGAGFLISKVL
jgi:hypothetical protein